jgi:hypothetical protein
MRIVTSGGALKRRDDRRRHPGNHERRGTEAYSFLVAGFAAPDAFDLSAIEA